MDDLFRFDESTGADAQTPVAWSFKGAESAARAEREHKGTTSVDAKIAAHREQLNADAGTNTAERDFEAPQPSDDDAPDAHGEAEQGTADVPEISTQGSASASAAKEKNDAFQRGTSFSASSFLDLNLSRPLLRACHSLGYTQPTPIQSAVIPLALTGRDILGRGVTGSGKTAAFMLPILERLLHRPKRVAATRALVLAPTRELAVQTHKMAESLKSFTDIRIALIVGGLSLNTQAASLRSQPEVVVGTPGRIIDHLRNTQSVDFESLATLVLDEADRLLDLGFRDELEYLLRSLPKRRQTMMFSATLSQGVEQLGALSLQNPARLASDDYGQAPTTLTEEIVRLKPKQETDREAALMAICHNVCPHRTLVFFATKHAAHHAKLAAGLLGMKAGELHGNLGSQAQRLEALEEFRSGKVDLLFATDIAARGLDVPAVDTVVSYDPPPTLDAYLHRVGRTARAGANGRAISIADKSDRKLIKQIAKRRPGQVKDRRLPDETITKWRRSLESIHKKIESILQEEKEEKEARKAAMEANKAENLAEHADTIMSRPKRTWFQSEKEKKARAKQAFDHSKAQAVAGPTAKKKEVNNQNGNGEEAKRKASNNPSEGTGERSRSKASKKAKSR